LLSPVFLDFFNPETVLNLLSSMLLFLSSLIASASVFEGA